MKRTEIVKKVDAKAIETIVKDEKVSKSAKVRQLFDGGLEVKEIAVLLGIRYNFAYNVLQNHVNINGIAVEKVQRDSKRDQIVELLKKGMSLADVSRETKTNYNYIWKISKELKDEEAKQGKVEVKAEVNTEVNAAAEMVAAPAGK